MARKREPKSRSVRVMLLLALAGIVAARPATATADGPGQAAPRTARTQADISRSLIWPTVMIRRGNARGSGTVILSRPDESLILTASHVAVGPGPLAIELHRFNYGSGHDLTEGGGWPRIVPAKLVAADPAADVAVIRVERAGVLPFVARLDLDGGPPEKGDELLSLGIDRGITLVNWRTAFAGVGRLDLGKGGGPRLFYVTARPPRHGRSGGGLYREDGRLIGVCVARARPDQARDSEIGIYATAESIRGLLREHHIDDELTVSDRRDTRTAGAR